MTKWKLTPLASAEGGTLVTALAAGADISNVAVKFAATTPSQTGEYLVFEPGSANMEVGPQLGTSTIINGDGTFTVKPPSYYAMKRTHAAGSIVTTTNSADGTHPSSAVQQAAAVQVIAAKSAIANLTAR